MTMIDPETTAYDKLSDKDKCIVMQIILQEVRELSPLQEFMETIEPLPNEVKQAIAQKLAESAHKIAQNIELNKSKQP